MSARRRTLEAVNPWDGDHGFTGIALEAWKRQRAGRLALVEHAAWRTSSEAKERGAFALLLAWARSDCCPQTLGRGGTVEGEKWASDLPRWPEEPDLSRAHLFRANLSGADLSRANLSGAYLSRANLSGANLSWANLSWANLSRANLSGADLSRANLFRADLFGADLSGADLSGADLSRANLSGANLSGADLSRANLFGANLGPWELGADGIARRKEANA